MHPHRTVGGTHGAQHTRATYVLRPEVDARAPPPLPGPPPLADGQPAGGLVAWLCCFALCSGKQGTGLRGPGHAHWRACAFRSPTYRLCPCPAAWQCLWGALSSASRGRRTRPSGAGRSWCRERVLGRKGTLALRAGRAELDTAGDDTLARTTHRMRHQRSSSTKA